MGAEARQKFIDDVEAQMKQNPYNAKVYEMLNELSEVKILISDAEKNGEDTTELIEKAWAIVFELEEYGVVPEERLLQNKEYWKEKAKQAIE